MYENHLTVNEGGAFFVVQDIEKVGSEKFRLHLIFVGNVSIDKPKDAGFITVTVLDDQHALIDNTDFAASGFSWHGIVWRGASPKIKGKKTYSNLPDAKLDTESR